MIPHAAQLYRHASQIELVETGDIGAESFGAARSKPLVAQESQDTVGTLVDQPAHGAMGFGIETEHLVEDIVVGMVEAAHVA